MLLKFVLLVRVSFCYISLSDTYRFLFSFIQLKYPNGKHANLKYPNLKRLELSGYVGRLRWQLITQILENCSELEYLSIEKVLKLKLSFKVPNLVYP